MAENVAAAGEVEVTVVGEVDRRGAVGRGGVIDPQLVAVGERHHHGDGKIPGITFLAIRTEVAEGHSGFLAGQDLGRPHDLVETRDAAVQMVRAVVDGQLVLLSVEPETAFGRAVGHASGRAAQIAGIAAEVLFQIIEPQHDVAKLAPAVRHVQLGDDGAVVSDLGDEAMPVGQRKQINATAGGVSAEQLLGDGGVHELNTKRPHRHVRNHLGLAIRTRVLMRRSTCQTQHED